MKALTGIFCIMLLAAFTNISFNKRKSNSVGEQLNKRPADNPLLIEQTEIAAWKDLLDAASDSFRRANGMQHHDIGGGMAINFQKMPIPLFNRVIGLGLTEPLTQGVINQIKALYTHKEKYLIHYSNPMRPANADSLLKENGFYLAGSWERIIRDDQPLNDITDSNDIEVRRVDESNKENWVKFLIDTYGFNFYEWPRAFALRKGWKHYIALRNDKIIACRSFFMTPDKTIFSGVDAPVPGVMTPDCKPDFAIWKRAILDCLKEGATLFVADIESPDKEKNKAAYDGYKQLGFHIPYTRYHYRLNK
jgi:hypothetical protein